MATNPDNSEEALTHEDCVNIIRAAAPDADRAEVENRAANLRYALAALGFTGSGRQAAAFHQVRVLGRSNAEAADNLDVTPRRIGQLLTAFDAACKWPLAPKLANGRPREILTDPAKLDRFAAPEPADDGELDG